MWLSNRILIKKSNSFFSHLIPINFLNANSPWNSTKKEELNKIINPFHSIFLVLLVFIYFQFFVSTYFLAFFSFCSNIIQMIILLTDNNKFFLSFLCGAVFGRFVEFDKFWNWKVDRSSLVYFASLFGEWIVVGLWRIFLT